MLSTGFSIIARPHSVEFYPYSQQRGWAARWLSAAQDDLQTVLMMGRLHYREEPLHRVRNRVDQRTWNECRANDAALARECYRIAGIDGLCRLEGDFVLACYDRRTQRLVTVRDPMGKYPLFWTQQGKTIAVSTSMRPLADVMPDVELDPEYTADYLAFPYDFCAELPLQHTAYGGVQRLLPGWLLEANLSTHHVTCRPYWQWDDKIVPVAVRSAEEAGELVRERLEAAVRERVSREAQTASHFSGGFDSTGIALLASRLSGRPLHALSLVYQSERMLVQETEYIQAALESGGGAIVWHPVQADDLLDYDGQDRVPLLDEPSALGARWNSFALLAHIAAEAGADTVLSGDGSDHMFGHALHYFVAELLSTGRVRQAWRLANRYSYTSGQSALKIMTMAVKQFVPRRVRDGIGPLVRGGRAPFEKLTDRTIPPWFTDDFVRRHELRERILARQLPLSRSGFLTADALAFSAGDWLNGYAGLPHGVTMSRPYFDPRLMALGLSLPIWLHAQPGRMKPVLAAALRDVLPEKIVRRSRKVHFGLLMNGMARHHDALKAVIQEAPLPEGILHRPVLLDALAKTALGLYDQLLGVARLRVALSYLMWLSSRDAWRKLPVPTIALQQVCHDDPSTPHQTT